MFVVLGDVLELLFAHYAIEGSKGFGDLGLDISSASDIILLHRKSPGATGEALTADDIPLFPRVGLHSP